MNQDTKDDAKFEAWLVGFNIWAQECDDLLMGRVKRTRDDMKGYLWANAYCEGFTPGDAVEQAIRYNMEFTGVVP